MWLSNQHRFYNAVGRHAISEDYLARGDRLVAFAGPALSMATCVGGTLRQVSLLDALTAVLGEAAEAMNVGNATWSACLPVARPDLPRPPWVYRRARN